MVSDERPEFLIPSTVSLNGGKAEPTRPLSRWLLANRVAPAGPETRENTKNETHSWWKVMTLTGVDYFSTLSYLPAIAVLAAASARPEAAGAALPGGSFAD